jgi:hypothetical protein
LPEGRPISGKATARRKKRLRRFKISGRIGLSDQISSRLCRDTGPPSTAGFVFLDGLFSTAGAVPANLPVGRDLTIRRKIENGWYYCALGRSKSMKSRGTLVVETGSWSMTTVARGYIGECWGCLGCWW